VARIVGGRRFSRARGRAATSEVDCFREGDRVPRPLEGTNTLNDPAAAQLARRRQLETAWPGVSIDTGVPTRLSNGLHWAYLTVGEQRQLVESPEARWQPFFFPLEGGRAHLFEVVQLLSALHMTDDELTDVPDRLFAPNFGYVLTVRDSHAIGYLVLCDEQGEEASTFRPRALHFTVLVTVWVARMHRKQRIASALLAEARSRFEITKLTTPFTAAGRAWLDQVAPELTK
jgi:hypothetical protein